MYVGPHLAFNFDFSYSLSWKEKSPEKQCFAKSHKNYIGIENEKKSIDKNCSGT